MKAARLWPAAILGVLAVTVGANLALLHWANGPDAAAIEPDYYAKALRWDSTLTQRARDARLGWRIEAELGAPAATGMPLEVRLTDAAGAPLSGAAITVEAIHNAEPSRRPRLELGERQAGTYAGVVPRPRPGLWELRFAVTRGGERFTASLRREAGEAAR